MRRSSEDIALTLIAGALREGGATAAAAVNADTPCRGFMVAVPGMGEVIPLSDLQPYRVVSFLDRAAEVLSLPDVYAGIWVSDGLVFLDVSVCAATLDEAMAVAAASGERAVYDLLAGRDVLVGAVA